MKRLGVTPFLALGVAWIGAVGLLVAGAWMLYHFPPGQSVYYPQCVLHRLTGWHCPGCGSLRAMHQIMHGDFGSAWRSNALLMLGLALSPLVAVGYYVGRKRDSARTRAGERWRNTWTWILLGLVLGYGVARNLPVKPFIWLAPSATAVVAGDAELRE